MNQPFSANQRSASNAAAQPLPAATFIHSYAGHGVVESPLSAPWARRIAAIFRFPEEDA